MAAPSPVRPVQASTPRHRYNQGGRRSATLPVGARPRHKAVGGVGRYHLCASRATSVPRVRIYIPCPTRPRDLGRTSGGQRNLHRPAERIPGPGGIGPRRRPGRRGAEDSEPGRYGDRRCEVSTDTRAPTLCAPHLDATSAPTPWALAAVPPCRERSTPGADAPSRGSGVAHIVLTSKLCGGSRLPLGKNTRARK